MSTTLEHWYQQHHHWLQGWLGKRLGCRQQAADLAHDTFLRLLTRPQHSDSPRALLSHIAQGLLVDKWRRQDVERAYAEAVAALPPAHAPSPETALQVIDTVLQLDALLAALPARSREVFWLAQIEELPYADIARRLGISLATVKRHLREALLQCLLVLD